jgi:predicted nucleic acid-binding protein
VTFVDTSFWVGRALPRDSRHESARALEDVVRRERLATTELILGEVWILLRRRLGHLATHRVIDSIRSLPAIQVENVDSQLAAEAWAWLRVHDERAYSFVDATSFALMRKLRITDALAFDGDFAAAGFVELRP